MSKVQRSHDAPILKAYVLGDFETLDGGQMLCYSYTAAQVKCKNNAGKDGS